MFSGLELGIYRPSKVRRYVEGLPQDASGVGGAYAGGCQMQGGALQLQKELKEATEMVRSRNESLVALENDKKYALIERDRAKVDLEKAKATLNEHEKLLASAVRGGTHSRPKCLG